LFLERLMKNVRKEASSKSFNLKRMKKIAAEPAIQMPPMPPAEAPVEAPVVLPEEISVDIPRDIRELIDQVIAKGPSPLPIFLFDNPEYINYFKDKINKQAGDPNSALFSLIEYQDATTNAYPGKKDKIIKSFGIQTMIGDPIQPQQEERVEEQHQVPDYDGDDLFNLVFNKILEDKRWWSKLKAGGYDEDSINEAVLNRLAPNIDSIDPRIMFFMNRPQYIDSPLKENLEQDKANGSVVTKQQFVDYVVQNGFASELYQKMREMINNDETFENDIIPWLKGVQKGSKLKQQYKPEISTATPLGGEGTGDLGSLLEDKGSRVRSQDTTMEDKELASKLNKNASVFVHGYLKKMFDQVRELVFKSIGDALSYASDARTLGDDKKAKNLEKFGQKMLFFIDSNVKQLENILSHESGNFRAKETSAGIRYGDQKNGFITLPRSEVENLIQYIYTTLKDTKYTEDTEDSEARTPDIDPDSPEVQQIIKQYLESGQSQWFPDLSNWIHDDVVNQRYKEVGQLKRLIKSYKTEGIKLDDQAKIIIDKANLYNLFPDKNDTLSFIKTTLTEDDDYIEKQWGKAGEGVRPAEAVGKKKAREGGGSPLQSKGELSTAVKHFLPYLYKNKVEGGYSSSILSVSSIFSISFFTIP